MTWVPCANIILGESDYRNGAPICTYASISFLKYYSTNRSNYKLSFTYQLLILPYVTATIFPIQYDF